MSITEPGLYDIPEADYHADADVSPDLGRPLSYSGAKTLLVSPARFAWEREHGRPSKRAYDLGSLVHTLILGSKDDRITVVDAYDWRTKAAQAAKTEAYAAGRIPVHRGDLLAASTVAAAVRRHPLASAILREGRSEVSLYWVDTATGVTCRGRIDWLSPLAIVDVKTVSSYGGCEPAAFARAAAGFDYPMQAAAYTEGYEAVTGRLLDFVTIAVEMEPPHFVSVTRYPASAVAAGAEKWHRALAVYAARESSGEWADPPAITTLPIPAWYGRTYPEETE